MNALATCLKQPIRGRSLSVRITIAGTEKAVRRQLLFDWVIQVLDVCCDTHGNAWIDSLKEAEFEE